MLLIPCPYCGFPRPEIEFRHAGEAHLARPEEPASDGDYAAFLYLRENPKGITAERWRHVHGCGRYFNLLRDTVSDRILAVYKPGEKRPEIAS
ncbi:MAG: sarcosine oxidase subunit delta [Rhabdaerophilum sp.]